MKSKSIKSLIVSMLTAISFGCVFVSTTFALFTDEEQVTINATSGTIQVVPTCGNIQSYSAVADSQGDLVDAENNHYSHQLQPVVDGKYTFSQGGYATYNQASMTFALNNIVAGDKITFPFTIANNSTVITKYRFSYQAIDNGTSDYLALAKGLKTTITVGSNPSETFVGLEKYRSAWSTYAVGANPDSLTFSIELPMNVGDAYNGKNSLLCLRFEAIQGNAYTDNQPKEVVITEEDLLAQATITSSNTILNVRDYSLTIPTGTTANNGEVFLNPDDSVSLNVKNIKKIEQSNGSAYALTFDMLLKKGDTVINNFSNNVAVSIDIGLGHTLDSVKLNDTQIVGADYSTNLVTFSTQTFASFSVEYH